MSQGYRTARERAASAAGARAVERARAHTAPSFDPDATEEAEDITGYITPPVARLIRQQIERKRESGH